MKMNQTSKLAALVGVLAGTLPAFALTDSYQTYFPPVDGNQGWQTMNWAPTVGNPTLGNPSGPIPQWNPSVQHPGQGAILDSITIELIGSIQADQTLGAGQTSITGNVETDATITVNLSGAINLVQVLPTVISPTVTLTGSGIQNVAGQVTNFPTASNTMDSGVVNVAGIPVLGPTIYALMQGNGNLALGSTGTSTFSVNAGGSGLGGSATSGQFEFIVNYNYHLPSVPEPKVYGALGAVACLGLLGFRQYRRRNA
jgi:hypothetical protein